MNKIKKMLMAMAIKFLMKEIAPYVIDQFDIFSKELVASSRTAVSEHDAGDVVDIAKQNVQSLFNKVGLDINL